MDESINFVKADSGFYLIYREGDSFFVHKRHQVLSWRIETRTIRTTENLGNQYSSYVTPITIDGEPLRSVAAIMNPDGSVSNDSGSFDGFAHFVESMIALNGDDKK